MSEASPPTSERARPGLARRLAAGAWHIPGGLLFLARRPRLWPLALVPLVLTAAGLVGGLILGLYAIRAVESAFGRLIAALPEIPSVLVTVALWAGTLAAGALLGLAGALFLSAPAIERLSWRVEHLVGGVAPAAGKGLRWELSQALRGSLYFVAAAPAVFALGLLPLVGPVAGALWGAHALAHQLTDAPLTRRGLDFRARRAWHRAWRPESLGFGLGGLVTLLVPGANLLLGPALAIGGTLLVIELQSHAQTVDDTRPAPLPPAESPTEADAGPVA